MLSKLWKFICSTCKKESERSREKEDKIVLYHTYLTDRGQKIRIIAYDYGYGAYVDDNGILWPQSGRGTFGNIIRDITEEE